MVSCLFSGVGNGTRTHNARNHNPVLCQLNYTHHILFAECPDLKLARQKGLAKSRFASVQPSAATLIRVAFNGSSPTKSLQTIRLYDSPK